MSAVGALRKLRVCLAKSAERRFRPFISRIGVVKLKDSGALGSATLIAGRRNPKFDDPSQGAQVLR